jgi:DNA-directed RNA polymerase specialized sigma24 family protein
MRNVRMRSPVHCKALLALTPREAEVWELRELGITEIAARLGTKYASVQRLLSVARDKMRVVDAERLEREAG